MERTGGTETSLEGLETAISGGIAIQRDERFIFVSNGFAALAEHEPDSLVDADWQTPFDSTETRRLERDAIATAYTDGAWSGEARINGQRSDTPVGLSLTAVGDDLLLWILTKQESNVEEPDDMVESRSSRFYSRPAFVRTVLDALDDILYVIDKDGESFFWNQALVDTTGYSHAEIDTMHPMDFVPEDQHKYVPGLMEAIDAIEDRRIEVDILTASGNRITHEFKGASFEDPVTNESFRCGLARDITERKERERKLERQRDELTTLDRINELLLETVRELTQAPSREAVEQMVCERLAESAFYRFAWVGELELDGNRIVPRVTAGRDDGYLDAVTITIDGGDTGSGPGGRALRTGEVQVANVDDPAFEPWQTPASERGFRSVAAVPLQHRGTVYGVLVVYATREDAFTAREQAGFDVLGRTVGTVIAATRSRKLLFADSIIELEFDITYVDSVFHRIADHHGCEITLDGYVASGDRWILYCSVHGASPNTVAESAATNPQIERSRVIDEGEQDGRIELVQTGTSLLQTVTAAGASVRSWTTAPHVARLVIQARAGADVRAIVNDIRSDYPKAKLLSRHEPERKADAGGPPGGILDKLTDRQREAIEAAYHAGYFAWPRESTAEELAASLGLASPTLHGHLRKAEETLLSELLGER